MNWVTAVTLGTSVVLAIVAALLAYRNSVHLAQRAARLDRISRQLTELYGPLLALSRASYSTFTHFSHRHRPPGGFRRYLEANPDPDDPVAVAFRVWMTHIFMPQNRRMADVIVSTADLIEGDAIPQCFLDVCAHVASYEALLVSWERGDYSDYRSAIDFPGAELFEHVALHFGALKREQARLLGEDPTARQHPLDLTPPDLYR